MYIVFDDYGNCYDKMDYNKLRAFLVDEIIRDGINRLDEDDNKTRIKECLNELKNLALDHNTTELKFIISQLFEYGWYVQDLEELHTKLKLFKDYMFSKGLPKVDIGKGHIELTLNLIESEMK